MVDEAQDFNPLEFALLKKLAPGASMTVVGDLMQGVNGWRGLTGWEALGEGVFGGEAVTHFLVTSYRNTVEIMQTALRVARKRPTPGQQEARPVLRHGDAPQFLPFQTPKEQAALIASLIGAWRAQGLTSIAVISKSPKALAALQKQLPPELGAKLLDVNCETYEAGALLAPASAVKGLEFDGVILADAGEAAFGDADLDARLIYVCLTRALHQLAVLYCGPLTPLLREEA